MRKHEPQFSRGQEVTYGRYGPPLLVVDVDAGRVTCVDPKTGQQNTYSAWSLYKA